jgi:hypothetical protein
LDRDVRHFLGDHGYPEAGEGGGRDGKNCQTCHVAALPKKDSHEMNDAGKWLVAQKEKKGAKAVDGAWLKDYPGK